MSDVLQIIARLSVVVFIVSSMLAVGLSLTLRAIVMPLKDVRIVAFALLLNLILSPALAILLTRAFPLQRPYVVGLILLSLAAGAPFLPKLTEAAHGDPAFSVALMTLLMVGTLIVMPIGLPLLVRGMQANAWAIARPLLILMVLPMGLGMAVRAGAPLISASCRPVVATVSNVSLVLLLVLVIGLHSRALIGVVGSGAIGVSAVFVAILLVLGYLAGGPQPQIRGVLGLGSAARNVGAALPAAGEQSDPKVIVMLLVGTLVGVLLAFVMAAWLRRRMPVMAESEHRRSSC